MRVVDQAIRYPVSTTVGVLLLTLFGVLAVFRIPVQLTPTVEEPQVSVSTFWRGASPQEVEREIVEEQERQLKSLEGLQELESSSSDSNGSITLTFSTGTDLDAALLKVSNALEQVPRYPDDADKPVIRSVGIDSRPIAWFLLMASPDADFEGDVWNLWTFLDERLKPEFERVPGVGGVNIFGGRALEMDVVIDPERLAARQITINQVLAALDRENRDYSGGDFDEGKRRYVVRTVGEYRSPTDIEDVVIVVRDGVPIYVRDVGRAELGYAKARANGFYFGQKNIAFNAVREPGANVLEVMQGLRDARDRVDREILAPMGLHIEQAYDETDYIYSAIDLVKQSLLLGGVMAIAVLLLFLRSRSSTLIIAVAIPISVVGTFLMMALLGRTLNVISLAGMAFAIGMVVDNSIVVLENIYRHRQMGKPRRQAAFDGTVEVWGAVLASTLTTIAVFVPVLFVQQEAGQLFRDIAIAISCGVGLSLLVSITVIPSLAARILGTAPQGGAEDPAHLASYRQLWGGVALAQRLTNWVTDRVYWICGTTTRRLSVVTGFTLGAIVLSALLMPPAEYLPTGNRNLLFGQVQPPPGYSVDETTALQQVYLDTLRPLWETPPAASAALPGGGIGGFFFVASTERAFMGVRSRQPTRVRELLPLLFEANGKIPGAIAFTSQASLFARGLTEGRTIDIDLSGPELEQLVELGGEVFGRVKQLLPDAQARPVPSLDLGNPEVQVRPNRRRAAELGISNRDLGAAVSVLIDGAKASDYLHEGQEIDLRLKVDSGALHRTHLIEQMPIAAPSGELITIGSVAQVELVSGPTQINHRERERTITISVTPPETTPLQAAMTTIQEEILAPMTTAGKLGGLYRARLSGTADKLTETGRALAWNFVLAVVITYLLMAALFESFLYPFVILFSVPLAALGGFLGLGVVHAITGQALDVLTMLGFIILVGTVVNNAILVVHQSLHLLRQGVPTREAIRDATATRIRPIFMSVGTSVCGMLPLVLFPGAGSELYRGLGSVVIGGLAVSTLFTLFLVPALFSLVMEARDRLAARIRGPLSAAETTSS